MADTDPCDGIRGEAKKYCERGQGGSQGGDPPDTHGTGGVVDGAGQHVKDLADSLITALRKLVAPGKTWAPQRADSGLYEPFLWLGQHLAVAILLCVVVVCALTAWQGVPRLRQMGASTGWALGAVAGMASVPGIVMLLNTAVSRAFTTAFNSNESTLFTVISGDLKTAPSFGPVGYLLVVAALVVALAFAALVFLTRNLGILVFVCAAPLVLASLARGGDTTAVRAWINRLLGLLFAPFGLLVLSPFVQLARGNLVLDAVLLVAADAVMLRMIFHGVPWIGPRIAGAARTYVEGRTDSLVAHGVMRAGVPDVYEQESGPRRIRTVNTPGRAIAEDRSVLLAAYGIRREQRPGRLTTASAITKTRSEAARSAQIIQARREARAAVQQPVVPPQAPATGAPAPGPRTPRPTPRPAPGQTPTP